MQQRLYIAVAVTILSLPAYAIEYAGTCRGASATVTEVEGLDTPRARMTARMTMPDAIAYCHYSLGRAIGKRRLPTDANLQRCARDLLRDTERSGPVRATANCMAGTISTAGEKWSNAYKLPLQPICGDDNNQAINLFKVLCPSYEGKIEIDE